MRIPLLLAFLFATLLSPSSFAGGPTTASAFDHKHGELDGLLRRHVDAKGLVDYSGVAGDPALGKFIAAVGAVSPEEVGAWSRAQQIAFYINAYNALTLKTIVVAGTVESIRDIKPDAWENARWTVAGRAVSLNWIEHTKLRETLKEPRVHFVLVCAAIGCPRLPNRAIVAEGLDDQLDALTKAFFADPAKNRVDVAGGKVHLSRILDWYGDDFVGWKGTPAEPALPERPAKEAAAVRLLSRSVGEAERAFLAKGVFTVVFNEYDWALNAR